MSIIENPNPSQKQEALKRMKALGLLGEVRRTYNQSNKLWFSERQNKLFNAALYYVENSDFVKVERAIADFVRENPDKLPYHAQLTHMEFGDCLAILYVGEDESEWGQDLQDLANGEALAYVANLDDPSCSEFGYIGIEPSMGGITRTY